MKNRYMRRLTALRGEGGPPTWLMLLLVAMASLMLEVGYTRVVSFKLWYYYTYLVIGLSLMGIGSGGVIAAVSPRIKRATTESIVAVSAILGAVFVAVGYFVVARLPVDALAIWRYGEAKAVSNLAVLAVICLALFAGFIAMGVIIAVVLGRAGDRVGRLYFADLLGAAAGCLLAIPLITSLGPPRLIFLSAFIFGAVGLIAMPFTGWQVVRKRSMAGLTGVVLVVLAVFVGAGGLLPDVRPEESKFDPNNPPEGSGLRAAEHSEWGPVFRVDVIPPKEGLMNRLLFHDGNWGSGIFEFNGDVASLDHYDADVRSLPFRLLDRAPEETLIIGSAGGNEILASLYHDAESIQAVELNPVTVSLLKDHYRELTGDLPNRPEVDLTLGDGRTYLARSDDEFDLVWFVAPDSYAANNAASSGAFVLSESYLYTTEMVQETVEHLTDDGIMVVQFGELAYERSPNRTARYVVTARDALRQLGVEDPSRHIAVAADVGDDAGTLATIVVKRTPFTPEEVERFTSGLADITAEDAAEATAAAEDDPDSDHVPVYAPGVVLDDETIDRLAMGDQSVRESLRLVPGLAGGDEAEVAQLIDGYEHDINVVRDDKPFFWHFSSFGDVVGDITSPIEVNLVDPEVAIGERVLVMLLLLSAGYAAIFLLLPFVTVRKQWRAMPHKGMSALYFACLGLGFMFYEISMIQRLVLFLGYPTLSLTVTLAAVLVFTGIGALLSEKVAGRSQQVLPLALGALALLTLFYRFGLGTMTDAYLAQPFTVRVILTLLVLAPLGLCLGMFMPLGLKLVSGLSEHGEQYVAWSWAVNGFFSVIGSVLTTILSMMLGFKVVQLIAFAVYVLAVASFVLLQRRSQVGAEGEVAVPDQDELAAEAKEPTPAPA